MNEIQQALQHQQRETRLLEEPALSAGKLAREGHRSERVLAPLVEEGPAWAILDVVLRSPGCNLERLQRCCGLSRRRFEPALKHLVEARRVAIHANGQTQHVLPFVPGIRDCGSQVLVLLKPGVPDLHVWHHQQGPCTRAALVSHAQHCFSWGEHLIKKRIQQMIKCHLMQRAAPPVGEDQRVMWYEALDPLEPAKLALAAYKGHERFQRWLQHVHPKNR